MNDFFLSASEHLPRLDKHHDILTVNEELPDAYCTGARKRGRPRQRWLDTLKGYASGATISNMRGVPGMERDGEKQSPGVG